MSMVSFPFDSKIVGYDDSGYPQYDRAVNSSVLANMLNSLATTGVLLNDTNAFSVSAGDNMLVKVHAGSAIINGITCLEDTERTLSLQAADATYDRIDTVVLRLNTSVDVRAIDLYVVKGTASASPVAPVLTRSGSVYELGLANVYIPANVVTITNERITDTRGDSLRCGYSISAGYAGLLSQINALKENIIVEDAIDNREVTYSGQGDNAATGSSYISTDKAGYIPLCLLLDTQKTKANSTGATEVNIVTRVINHMSTLSTGVNRWGISYDYTVYRETNAAINAKLYFKILYVKAGV